MPDLKISGSISVKVCEDIGTVSKACSVLVKEYRENRYFRQAVADSITSVTADYGLSVAIADRLFDLEEAHADSKE